MLRWLRNFIRGDRFKYPNTEILALGQSSMELLPFEDRYCLAILCLLERFCDGEIQNFRKCSGEIIKGLREYPPTSRISIDSIDWWQLNPEHAQKNLLKLFPDNLFLWTGMYLEILKSIRMYAIRRKLSSSALDLPYDNFEHGQKMIFLDGLSYKWDSTSHYWLSPSVFAEQELLRSLKSFQNRPGAAMMNNEELARLFLSIPENKQLAEKIKWDLLHPVLPQSWDSDEMFGFAEDYYRMHFRETALAIRELILNPELLQQPKQSDCRSCRFFSGSKHLKCAVNPERSIDEDCGHWEKR